MLDSRNDVKKNEDGVIRWHKSPLIELSTKIQFQFSFFFWDTFLNYKKKRYRQFRISTQCAMPFVSRLRNEKTGHTNSDTRQFLLRWIEIIR